MGRIKSYIVKKLLDPIIHRVRLRIDYMEKLEVKAKKQKIINGLQSKGYNLRLNGDNHIITSPFNTIVGNNVHIGDNAYFSTEGGLIIGDNTHISRNVTIYTQNHNYSGKALPYDETTLYKPVTIHKNVWIGMNVSIIPGVTIGEGAIIGLGTLVNRNIEPLEIVGNVKCSSLKYRNKDAYSHLTENQRFGGVNGKYISDSELKLFKPTYEQNRQKDIVFVLSAGRSGSKAIVDVLNQHSQCLAFHENIHQLIRLSTNMAYTKDQSSIRKEIKAIFYNKIWESDDEIIIHSDQRLWNLVPYLASYFPSSKFVHLTRDPVKSIVSMVARNWYEKNEYPEFNKHDWAKYRLNGYLAGVVPENQWKEWSAIEKCSWYWCYINASIKTSLKELSPDRRFTLKLETLEEQISDFQDFLGLEKQELQIEKSNAARNRHKSRLESIDTEENKITIRKFIDTYNNEINSAHS